MPRPPGTDGEENFMDRLTKRVAGELVSTRYKEDFIFQMEEQDYAGYKATMERLAAYEDIGLTPEELKKPFSKDTITNMAAQVLGTTPERLRKLVEADRDGLCVVIPFNVGDTFYCTSPEIYQGKIVEYTVTGYRITKDGCQIMAYNPKGFSAEFVVRTVFMTREEAEAAIGGEVHG